MTWTIMFIVTQSIAWFLTLYGTFTEDSAFVLLGIVGFGAILATIAIALKFRYIVVKG